MYSIETYCLSLLSLACWYRSISNMKQINLKKTIPGMSEMFTHNHIAMHSNYYRYIKDID